MPGDCHQSWDSFDHEKWLPQQLQESSGFFGITVPFWFLIDGVMTSNKFWKKSISWREIKAIKTSEEIMHNERPSNTHFVVLPDSISIHFSFCTWWKILLHNGEKSWKISRITITKEFHLPFSKNSLGSFSDFSPFLKILTRHKLMF